MSCHTWFYKKSNITIEEAHKLVVAQYEDNIKLHKTICEAEDMVVDGTDWKELLVNNDLPSDYFKTHIDIVKRKIRIIKKGHCNVAVMNRLEGIYISDKGEHYIAVDTHDLFRIGNYPDDNLFSLEDTLKFIKDNRARIHFSTFCPSGVIKQILFEKMSEECENKQIEAYTLSNLKEFWKEHPDGMIQFG